MLVPLPDSATGVKTPRDTKHTLSVRQWYGLSPVGLQQVELPSCDCLDNLPIDCSFFFQYLSSVVVIDNFLGLGFWGLRRKEIGVEA